MEDVLEVYHRRYGDNEVLVCLDETSKQQVKETRTPLPPRPGVAMAYDCEYERNGVSNLFMLFAPLEGWRRVEVTDRRTKLDWARVVRQLVDVDYPDRDRIVLVMDNLNTHLHPCTRHLSLRRRGDIFSTAGIEIELSWDVYNLGLRGRFYGRPYQAPSKRSFEEKFGRCS